MSRIVDLLIGAAVVFSPDRRGTFDNLIVESQLPCQGSGGRNDGRQAEFLKAYQIQMITTVSGWQDIPRCQPE